MEKKSKADILQETLDLILANDRKVEKSLETLEKRVGQAQKDARWAFGIVGALIFGFLATVLAMLQAAGGLL